MGQADRPAQLHPEPDGEREALEVLDPGQVGLERPRLTLFAAVQLEFPWALGPPDGRYVVRGSDGEVEWVVVLATLGAPERRRLGRRGRREPVGSDPPPAPVTTGRATLVRTGATGPAATAEDPAAALAVLNRLLHAHRIATRDPEVHGASLGQALTVRLGQAVGEDAAAGRLTEGVELPSAAEARRPSRRASTLRPAEHLAAILAGRVRPLATEALALRAREDLDAGRLRDAALQLDAALRAALSELPAEEPSGDLTRRIAELGDLVPPVEALADAEDPDPEAVAAPLRRLEAALRARAINLT